MINSRVGSAKSFHRLKTFYTWLGVLFFSFTGSALFFIFWAYCSGCSLSCSPDTSILKSDPVSIANTYIVFTTLFFVIISVLLAFVGYYFAQQFSLTKEEQIVHLFNELKTSIMKNESKLGEILIDSALENVDAKRYFEKKLSDKFEQMYLERENGETPDDIFKTIIDD